MLKTYMELIKSIKDLDNNFSQENVENCYVHAMALLREPRHSTLHPAVSSFVDCLCDGSLLTDDICWYTAWQDICTDM